MLSTLQKKLFNWLHLLLHCTTPLLFFAKGMSVQARERWWDNVMSVCSAHCQMSTQCSSLFLFSLFLLTMYIWFMGLTVYKSSMTASTHTDHTYIMFSVQYWYFAMNEKFFSWHPILKFLTWISLCVLKRTSPFWSPCHLNFLNY